MNILSQDELMDLLGIKPEKKEVEHEMIKEHYLCFSLGYDVSDKKEFRHKLVGLFGMGGTVSRDRDGNILDFTVLTDFGTMSLKDNNELDLQLECVDEGRILRAEDIQKLHQDLQAADIIKSGSSWFIKSVNVYEI